MCVCVFSSFVTVTVRFFFGRAAVDAHPDRPQSYGQAHPPLMFAKIAEKLMNPRSARPLCCSSPSCSTTGDGFHIRGNQVSAFSCMPASWCNPGVHRTRQVTLCTCAARSRPAHRLTEASWLSRESAICSDLCKTFKSELGCLAISTTATVIR